MRVLTVRQPWAGSIIHHRKDVENRSRNIAGSYRGPVAIHVSLRHDYEAQNGAHNDVLGFIDEHHTYGWGHVIGVVDLVGIHPASGYWTRNNEWRRGCCASAWAQCDHSDRYSTAHLELANPRPLATPIPAKGRLGLWRPDDDLTAAIREQVPA